MADHHDVEDPDVMPELPHSERETAPQSDYTMGQVGTGLAVLVVGLALTYGLGLAV